MGIADFLYDAMARGERVQVLDESACGLLLDGRGNPLPDDADAVWLEADPLDVLEGRARNSRGELFEVPEEGS